HEGRGSSRPLLPQGPCRRRRQRHTDRRRPQLPPHPRLAEEAVALNLPRSVDRPNRPTNLQSGFLTANYLPSLRPTAWVGYSGDSVRGDRPLVASITVPAAATGRRWRNHEGIDQRTEVGPPRSVFPS